MGFKQGINTSRFGFALKRKSTSLPVNTVAPVISGLNIVDSTLSCTTGSWTGTAPIMYTYQWKRNGANIGGATNSTYVLVTADASTNITCEVTATNVSGANSATSNTLIIDSIYADSKIATALLLGIYPTELVNSQKPLAQLINFMQI